ncbi:MAG: tetratricopeptide repeat protein, partial [Gammaproteobacteria bacterium]|nr:tetratricopeptide repeat protein [Gammaproteobacteria bacterium]
MNRLTGLILILSFTAQPALGSWFENSEQTGKRLFDNGEFSQSANAFNDTYRRGVALYMAGEYKAAESEFEHVEREEVLQDARYNMGNARFQQENFEGAVRAYDEVLAREPEHSEARHNQGLAKAMLAKTDPQALARLEQEKEEQEEQKEKEEKEEEEQGQESKSEEQKQEQESQSGDQKQEQESQSGDQKQEQESQSGDQKQEQESQSGDQKQEQESQSGDQKQEQESQSGDQKQEQESQSGDQKQEQESQSGDQK